MPCYELDGIRPVVHPSAFVHPTAVLIGDVVVGAGCYVGPVASLRGDMGRILLEEGSNVQDSCVMHGFPGMDSVIEANASIGHGAVIHGARIGRGALVGMNAVVMDGAQVGEAAIVAACAFVKAGMEVPAKMLAAGVPARILRELTAEEVAWKAEGTGSYQELTRRSRASMREVAPLAAEEPDRKRMQWSGVVPLSKVKAGA